MIYLELATVAALMVVNGLLAMAELAVVSSRPARLRVLIEHNVQGARRALALASDPGRFLSSVQIGITLIGILSGAFSGATLGLRIGEWLGQVGLAPKIAETTGVAVVVAVITYASLVIGELVPKQIALRDPETLAARVAPAMTVMARVASPIVWLLDASGDAVLRVLGYGTEVVERVTDEEIHALIAEAESAGVIEPGERAMIAGVMRLGDRPVRAVMTPRRAVDMIDLSDGHDVIRRNIKDSIHSQFPVHEGSPDRVLGVIQVKDLLDAYLAGSEPDIRRHVRPAPVVPDSADAVDALDLIRASAVHVALVHNEYGNFEGIVTNADILESIVGEFRTAAGPIEPDAVQRDDGSWLISGGMPIDEMAARVGLRLPEHRAFHTAAGFVLDHLGYLPSTGASFEAQGWRFEVVDIDGHRIDKILAARAAARPRRPVSR